MFDLQKPEEEEINMNEELGFKLKTNQCVESSISRTARPKF